MAINKINCALITTAKMKKVKFHKVFLGLSSVERRHIKMVQRCKLRFLYLLAAVFLPGTIIISYMYISTK